MAVKKITKKALIESARPLNIKGAAKLKKTALIHAIQTVEGNNPCFLTIKNCAVSPCSYRDECQAA